MIGKNDFISFTVILGDADQDESLVSGTSIVQIIPQLAPGVNRTHFRAP